MLSVFQRHSRCFLFSSIALLFTFLLIASPHALPRAIFANSFTPGDYIRHRLEYAETTYQRMLVQREGLIQKYGPTRDKVLMFPPAEAPWPPYTVWDFIPPAFNCPHPVERVGTLGDGGKWVCGLERVARKPDCVVYSFGISSESSFEAEVLSRTTGCEVWGYDFSVESFGPEVRDDPALVDRAHFEPFGLAGTDSDGEIRMFTLQSLMARNGHKHIDILKVDIEGWEFEALASLIRPYFESGEPLPFGQMQLEVHTPGKTFDEFLRWWEMLEGAGLRPFWTEPNLVYMTLFNRGGVPDLAEYSFLNTRGDNAFLSGSVFSGPWNGSQK